MRLFAQLFAELDQTTRTSEKIAALETYFRSATPAAAAWGLWFLAGQRLKRAVKTTHLRQWAADAADLPLWLVEECYEHVGDLGETLALLLPPNPNPAPPPLEQLVEQRLRPLANATESAQRALLRATWAELDTPQRFLWHKLITGNFRVGVARALLVRALANIAGVEPPIMAHRLMGGWRPTPADFAQLISPEAENDDPARPYPFYLASPLEIDVADLGNAHDWQVEWKWDGIRAQLLRRAGQIVLWSRGEEIITASFPEIAEPAAALPDGTVLDGELLAWRDDRPLPFAQLQRRLNRREVSAVLRAQAPVVFMAYDLLERDGADWRARPLAERRLALEQTVARATEEFGARPPIAGEIKMVQGELLFGLDEASPLTRGGGEAEPGLGPLQSSGSLKPSERNHDRQSASAGADAIALRVSPLLPVATWSDAMALMEQARASGTEGIMLKRCDSAYGTGRQRGTWWKWKVAPFTCDAVLVAAQPGHGRRATLFTDYTFALWRDGELVPVAKAYSGLTDTEIDAVDAFVRANTLRRFGPVRSVKPELVFELAFEGIAVSTRHKAGLALRFPRIARWRIDKKPAEADSIETLRKLAAK